MLVPIDGVKTNLSKYINQALKEVEVIIARDDNLSFVLCLVLKNFRNAEEASLKA